MASFLYDTAKKSLLDGTWSFTGSTLKVMLVSPSYEADEAHQYVTTASAYELSGTGYTGGFAGSGRKTLASKTATVDSANHRVLCDAADLSWSGLDAGTVGGAVVIFETGGADSSSLLLAFLDVADTLTDGSAFPLTWPDTGLFYLG
jgi:hypothetical protein